MKRLVFLPLVAFLALACGEQELPTDGAPDPSLRPGGGPAAGAGPPEQGAPEGPIKDLIEALFPEPGLETAALAQFRNVAQAKEEGNIDEARAKAFDLIDFTLEKLEEGRLEDPDGGAGGSTLQSSGSPSTAEEGVSELIDLLLEFVGLGSLGVSPSVLTGQTDGVVALAFPDQDNLIVTPDSFAGTLIEAGDLDQETVVAIERLDPTQQPGGDCLPGGFDQREGCYRFEKEPDEPFEDDVLVGVCPVSSLRDETDPDFDEAFQLARFDPETAGGVLPLAPADEDFLDCSGFSPLATAGGSFWNLAKAGWRATGARALGLLTPAPLRAVNRGFGSTTPDFSRIGWARIMDVDILAGDGQSAPAGSPVPVDPEVRVTHGPEADDSNPIQGTDVTFTVVAGGGNVTTNTVATDASGEASVGWTLGGTGANELKVTVPGDSVVFSANASVSPIFSADFDDETAGSTPQAQDPEVGTWTDIFQNDGTIQVVSSLFGLSNPVVFDPQGDTDGQSLEGTVAGTPPTSGRFDVIWTMAADTLGGPDQKQLSVRDGDFDEASTVRLEPGTTGGDILAVTGNGTIDTGQDWSTGVSRSFRVRVDLDDGTYSLFIDGNAVPNVQNVAFQDGSAVDAIEAIEIDGGGSPAQQLALDDIRVVPVP